MVLIFDTFIFADRCIFLSGCSQTFILRQTHWDIEPVLYRAFPSFVERVDLNGGRGKEQPSEKVSSAYLARHSIGLR